MMKRESEENIKIKIGDWLENWGCKIYDEKKNKKRSHWGMFELKNIERGRKPDLVIYCRIKNKGDCYVALEIKPCYKHRFLLDGFDNVLKYFTDYYCWGAEYFINERPIKISIFALTTNFSPHGYLFEGERQFGYKVVKRGGWDAYPTTFTFARLLWRGKDNIMNRIKNIADIPHIERGIEGKIKAKENPHVGILISHPNPKKKTILLMTSENPYNWEIIKTTY